MSDNWASSYVSALAGLGIVVGNDNGDFEPERSVTRAEFLKMSLLAFGHTYSSADAAVVSFADVDTSHWTANVIGKAQSLGVIDGGTGQFRPNAAITRAEAMKVLLLAADISINPEQASVSFSDVSGWATKYVEKALELGIIAANPEFRPDDAITRAESSKVIVQAM